MIATSIAPTAWPEEHSTQEQELFQQLQEREPQAMALFFDHFFGPLLAQTRRAGVHEHVAEDLTQDIFLRVYRALPSFDPSRRLAPWVYTIAGNRIRDHWRKRGQSRQENVSIEDENSLPGSLAEDPVTRIENNEFKDGVRSMVESLPPHNRTVLNLRVFEDWPFEKIARHLNISVLAARKRYSRALQTLRELVPLPS